MKPCPFCGSVKLNITHSDSGLSAVECEQCGAAGPLDEEDAPAVERWDQRTDKAQIKSLMETPNIIPSVSGSPFAVNPELINEAKCERSRNLSNLWSCLAALSKSAIPNPQSAIKNPQTP
jgi:Lar family restriction alleviation protein